LADALFAGEGKKLEIAQHTEEYYTSQLA
jgi:hypothetical protein